MLTCTCAASGSVRGRDGPPAAAATAFVDALRSSDAGELTVEDASLVDNYETIPLYILRFTKTASTE